MAPLKFKIKLFYLLFIVAAGLVAAGLIGYINLQNIQRHVDTLYFGGGLRSLKAYQESFSGSNDVLVLEPALSSGALKTARKGVGRFVLEIEGRAAHSGVEPEKGLSAVLELAQQILRQVVESGITETDAAIDAVADAFGGAHRDVVPDCSLIALTYVQPDGSPAQYPANPNGSLGDIAGLCNPAGNVLGLMPHPEDHLFPWQHPRFHRGEGGQLGLRLFENGIKHA